MINEQNFRAGLLGRKLGHSYSKIIHKYLAKYDYAMFEREEDEVGDFIKNGPFDAINVTVPYKKTVIPFLDELSDTAKRLGAVNTVVRRADGTLYGDNTDFYGFSYMLDLAEIDVCGKKALVLGAGGASATVCEVLKERGASEIAVLNSRSNTPENIALHSDARVIVNATPVGMYPANEGCPVDIALFKDCEGVADLIYNPARPDIICSITKQLILISSTWRQHQIPQIKGSVQQDCLPYFSYQSQIQVVICTADQLAINQKFSQPSPWVQLIC